MSSDEKNILGKALLHEERLRTMANLYTTVDRMITGRRITVETTSDHRSNAPVTDIGYSKYGGESILFNAKRLTDEDINQVERLHGMNFHEVARSEYSMQYPSRNTDPTYKPAFQILEGMRSDNLFTATHQATGDWLSASVLRWISEIEDPNEAAKIHLSTHGRDFLPRDLREAAGAAFEEAFGAEARAEFEDVIETYNGLVLPNDKEQALELAQRYENLCQKYFDQSARQQPDPFDSGQQGEQQDTRQQAQPRQGTSGQQQAQRRRQDQQDDDEDQQDGQGQSGGEQGDGEEQEGESQGGGGQGQDGDESDQQGQGGGQGQDEGEGDEEGQGQGNGQGQPQGEGDQPSQGQGGKGEGSQQGTKPGGQAAGQEAGNANINDPRQLAKQALSNLMQSEEIRSEVERARQTIFKSKPADRLETAKYESHPVSPSMVSASRRFEREMRKIREEVEPGWNRRTDTGRINAARYLREGNRDTAYDAWDEGQMDAVDIEAVILADMSGSVGEHMTRILESVWGIKRALDAVEASTTVILYDAEAKFLYKGNEKASKTMMRYHFDGGGTEASEAVYQGATILSSSRRSVKIVIVITDGDWSYYKAQPGSPRHPDTLLKRMSKAGYITALAFVNTGYGPDVPIDKVDSHGCEIKQTLSVDGLGAFGRAIVRSAVAKRLVRK